MNYRPEDFSPLMLNVGYAVHDADWNWNNVRSPFARLYYVTEGSAMVSLPSGRVSLRPGHLYFIPPFTLHSDICDGPFVHYYIHLYEEPDSDVHVFEEMDFPVEIEGNETDGLLFRRLCEMNPEMRLPQSNPVSYDNSPTLIETVRKSKVRTFAERVESRGIIYMLLSRFLSEATPKVQLADNRIQHTVNHIRKNLRAHIDVDELAQMACMSKDHYIRVFKREMGETPMHYITMRKIECAEMMLSTEDMSVKSIAASLGFVEHSYFNRIFKKIVGQTPLEYRANTKI